MKKDDIPQAIKDASRVIDAWLSLKIKYDQTPGMSVGITYKGKLLYKTGFGNADIEKKIKATSKTNYRIASISKTFTTVAILQLIEKGKLRLDDPIYKYVRWFASKKPETKHITIQQILTHTAGVYRDGVTGHWETSKFPSLSTFKKSFSDKAVTFENLTQFKYSNFAFSVLGYVVKAASGIRYEDYIQKYILDPLGMKNTYTDLTEKSVKNLARGYGRIIPDEEREIVKHTKANAYAPAAGFVSNVEDLAKFISALSLRDKSKKQILGREMKKEMLREHWKTVKGMWYGLGVDVYTVENRKIVGHSGGFNGFITQISLDVENDIGVIVLSNSLESNIGSISTGIFQIIYSLLDKKDLYESSLRTSLKKYEGVYRSRWGDTVVVGVRKKPLAFSPEVSAPTKNGFLLKPQKKKHEFLFDNKESVFDSIGEIIKFVTNNKGKVESMLWSSMPAKKIDD